MGTDGKVKRLLPPQMDCYAPSFSPDGRYIAFEARRKEEENMQIYLLDLRTERVVALTNSPMGCHSPSWSRDGKRIAYSSAEGIFLLDLTKHKARRIINTPNEVASFPRFLGNDKLVFLSSPSNTFNPRLYVINIDAPNKLRELASSLKSPKGFPACSPDGQKIAFVSWIQDESGDVFITTPNGTKLRNLTGDIDGAGQPAWSPDSKWLVFASKLTHDGSSVICVIREDGKYFKKLTKGPKDTWPTWGRFCP